MRIQTLVAPLALVPTAPDYDRPGMDDEFFASVLKKWADSSQEVLNLKKRLTDVEQERDEFQRRVDESKVKDVQRSVQNRSLASYSCGDVEILDLDDVGIKLEKARFEYQRRLKELDGAREREEARKREIEELKQEITELRSQVQSGRTQHAEVSSQLWNLRFEKQSMATKISDLTMRLEQTEKAKFDLEKRSPDTHTMDAQQVINLQEQMTSLETQLQELQALSQNLESENTTLRGDLTAARESLQKFKESNKGLRTTIAQLSRIARNVAGASDAASTHLETPSARTSLEVPRNLLPSEIPQYASTPKPETNKADVDNDVTIVVDFSEHLTPMPPQRQQALASLRAVVPHIDINDEDNKFTRGLASAAIGKSIQSLIPPKSDQPKGQSIEEYLCPRLDYNPWCPSSPGQHGYIFIGFGKEKHTYITPQLRSLFIGLSKSSNKDERSFKYLGVYRVTRVDSLSVTEWRTLHNAVKQNCVQATKDKSRDPRTKEEIVAAYDSGEISVPCVKLECVEFDEDLYVGLLAFRAQRNSAHKASNKRNRNDDNESSMRLLKSKRSTSKRATQ